MTVPQDVKLARHAGDLDDDGHDTTGGGAPTTVNYLVGTADAGLSAEIVVGTTPGGELGGTWASPTVDATHSGSSHAGLSGQPGSTDVAVADGGTGSSTAAGARTNLGVGTGDSPQFAGINVGAASDTTVTRTGAGDIAVEGNGLYRAGGTDVPVADGGTGASTKAAAFDALSPMTTAGDLIVGGVSGAAARLAKGSDSQVLTVDPSTHLLVWATPSSGFANPMTTKGDLIVGDTGGSAIRKAVGTDAFVLTADAASTGGIKWAAASGGISSGTSNPGSPSDGDLFYRSDLNLIIRYVSAQTHWRCTCEHRETLGQGETTMPWTGTTNSLAKMSPGTANDLWIEKFISSTYVLTTNNGTNFWTLNLDKSDAAAADTSMGSFTTAADTVNNWTEREVAINATYVAASYRLIHAVVSKTLVPGALYWAFRVTYRKIVP